MTTPHDSTAEDLAEISPLGTDEAPPVLNTTPCADPEAYCVPRSPIENVLLIDGDNDPHVPPDARVTRATLVRVFLRPGALLPRNLEKPLAHLPNFCTVTSPKGGANAADFVMSLHAGMLHAVLPSHVPFLMVTNDATLSAMAAELQRLGRVATIWTSHPDAASCPRRRPAATSPSAPSPPATTAVAADGPAEAGARAPEVSAPPPSPQLLPPAAHSRRSLAVDADARLRGRLAGPSQAILPADSGEPARQEARPVRGRLDPPAPASIKDAPSRVKTAQRHHRTAPGSHGFRPRRSSRSSSAITA